MSTNSDDWTEARNPIRMEPIYKGDTDMMGINDTPLPAMEQKPEAPVGDFEKRITELEKRVKELEDHLTQAVEYALAHITGEKSVNDAFDSTEEPTVPDGTDTGGVPEPVKHGPCPAGDPNCDKHR